jgi:hypothetical protein
LTQLLENSTKIVISLYDRSEANKNKERVTKAQQAERRRGDNNPRNKIEKRTIAFYPKKNAGRTTHPSATTRQRTAHDLAILILHGIPDGLLGRSARRSSMG